MLLTGQWRLFQLIRQRHDKNYRLMQLNKEMMDYKTYAENIADGSISIHEMFTTPSSMFNRQMLYMNMSSQFCQMSAANQMQQVSSNPLFQNMMAQSQNAQIQQAYQQMMYRSFYKQAQEQFAKYESRLLNEKEKEMSKEKLQLEMELAMIEEEIKNTKDAVKNDVKNFVSEYA